MSHVQLLRAILHGLADPRSFSQGLFMQWAEAPGPRAATAPSQESMRKAFEVVFVDRSGWCNLAAHVSKSALKQVRLLPELAITFWDAHASCISLCGVVSLLLKLHWRLYSVLVIIQLYNTVGLLLKLHWHHRSGSHMSMLFKLGLLCGVCKAALHRHPSSQHQAACTNIMYVCLCLPYVESSISFIVSYDCQHTFTSK